MADPQGAPEAGDGGGGGAVALLPAPFEIDSAAVAEAARAAAAAVARLGARRIGWRRDVDFGPRAEERDDAAATLRA